MSWPSPKANSSVFVGEYGWLSPVSPKAMIVSPHSSVYFSSHGQFLVFFTLLSLNFYLTLFSSVYAMSFLQNDFFHSSVCFSIYSLPSAMQNQYFCVAVYPMSSFSLLSLLHLHGYSFSNTLQFINLAPVNLMLKLPCSGRWRLLLWHGPCPPHTHKMWCLQVRTLDFGVSKEGLLKGQWGSHRAGWPVVYLGEISLQESSSLQGDIQALTVHGSNFLWASQAVLRIRSQSSGYPMLCHS